MSETIKTKKAGGVGTFYLVMLVLLLIALAVNAIYGFLQTRNQNTRIALASEMKVLSQQIATNASESAQGTQEAFVELQQASNKFDANLRQLTVGDEVSGLPAAPEALKAGEIAKLATLWQQVKPQTDAILNNQQLVNRMYTSADELSATIPTIQASYEEVIDTLVDSRASTAVITQANRQQWLSERISSGIQKVLRGGEEAAMSAQTFGNDVDTFGNNLNGAIEGDPLDPSVQRIANPTARGQLENVKGSFDILKEKVDYIIFSTPKLFEVQKASDTIFDNSDDLLDNTSALEAAFSSVSTGLTAPGSPYLSAILFGTILFLLFLVYLSQRKAEKARFAESLVSAEREKEENAQNQEAIIRLLDEIDSLADGDLTVKATVTEDFTGAIADSFNLTIDQLRGVVGTINDTVRQVTKSTEDTVQTSMALAQASRQQSQEITGASAAINEMAASIEQVSTNASESSQVAEKSVEIAKKGGEVVRNTIKGMDTIREQIQETSKRIKRLGESSQEIGNIVSLINDIADQTNILALNAAIQASAAGEAGRGFAVVADEVQRLAERSGNATKQIEALVKTIQNDTNEAVISMEDTTSEVVRGARLAQDAGISLEEIESVSTNLAGLIQSISNAARQQAASAGHVSNTMNVIQEITTQTSEGTNETADSIGQLSQLTDDLRRSVAGFKLDSTNDDLYALEDVDLETYEQFEDDVSIEEMLEQTEEGAEQNEEQSDDPEIGELEESLSELDDLMLDENAEDTSDAVEDLSAELENLSDELDDFDIELELDKEINNPDQKS